MGGAELVHAIRRSDPGLAAVIVTAHAGDADLEAARREGLLAVLPKPVPLARLLGLLGCARRDGLVAVLEDDRALARQPHRGARGARLRRRHRPLGPGGGSARTWSSPSRRSSTCACPVGRRWRGDAAA